MMQRRNFLKIAGAGAIGFQFLESGFAKAEPGRNSEEIWIMPPPWEGNGQCLREMLRQEGEWSQSRRLIQGIGYWPWLLNQYHSDEDIKLLFARLKEWNLKLGFEVPVLKAGNWGYDAKPLQAKGAFDQFQQFVQRFKALGMDKVDWITFDEPIYAARHQGAGQSLPVNEPGVQGSMAPGIAEMVSFVSMMRQAYPESKLGDIEPYPALTFEEITGAIERVQKTCAEKKIKGLDFLRLDVDWDRMERNHEGSWAEVKKIESLCHDRGLGFGLIYWAADQPRLAQEGVTNSGVWRAGILHQKRAYAQAGGKPDQIVIESWLHVPAHAVPETYPDTFMGSVSVFLAP